ncbi:ATP-binding protein [Algoriphagus limi]|uniref:histidine kinase n=1 Tax=Algoriphagus limi TaxID=2975273 RepID=A0ABT2GBE0_9BACT|nr:ATP-binding protein [Algoriphagus limi]MCS5491320.1 ATP-binding protein [Algoriphagus limi]
MKEKTSRIDQALAVYHAYWDSYLQFDEEAFAATLDDHFEMIGTSETEICHSKAEGIAFLKAQKDELGGKAEMRNRQVNPIWIDPHVLINETCDIYVKTDEQWNFYASIRISTILRETPAGWKVAQQHGSFPDMRVDEGQTLAIKKISKENQELREAVKRRTVELEAKNRELEIEASLERVRTVAMGMKKPEDMLDVCRILADQLQGFGIENIRNVQTAIINEEKGHYLCYQYFPPYQENTVELTEYLKSPVEYEMVQQMLASKDGHFIGSIQGEKLKEFAAHRKEENHFSDPILDQTSELSYCFLSIGEGGLGLSLYNELKQEVLDLFKRFHQVFSLAYRRFLDIQQAEAQAREAQIEASLERVRAHAMGLRQSDELEDIIAVIFEELQKLGLAAWECSIFFRNGNSREFTVWGKDSTGDSILNQYQFPFLDHPVLNAVLRDFERQVPYREILLEGEEIKSYGDLIFSETVFKDASQEYKDSFYFLQKMYAGQAMFKNGFLEAVGTEPLPGDFPEVLQRFAQVIDLAYTRFLDLQKAEAQTREAQIETALERVRSRTMAMQSSNELSEAATEMFSQIKGLGLNPWSCGFNIFNEDKTVISQWVSSGDGRPIKPFDTPTTEGIFKRIVEDSEKEISLRIEKMEGKKLEDTYNYMASLPTLDKIFEELDAAGIALPKSQVDHAAYFKYGYLMFITFDEVPEFHSIFKRFAKVFEQTYTRFLDLQKAENQAREAQIEAALERVRAAGMAMHRSEDLAEASTILFEQLKELGVEARRVGFALPDEEKQEFTVWSTIRDDDGKARLLSAFLHYDQHPIYPKMIDNWHAGQKTFGFELHGPALQDYYKAWNKTFKTPDSLRKTIQENESEYYQFASFQQGLIYAFTATPLGRTEHQLLSRFAKAFEQTYTRFLDLQKAEAQAREAQIEAALERVRSRSMAMHSSSELADLSMELVKQVQNLGMDNWFCAFNIDDGDPQGSLEWGSNGNMVFQAYRTPREGVFLKYYEAGKRGETLLVNEITEEECPAHYDYLCSLPGVGDQLLQMKSAGIPFPTYQIDHVAYFKYGYLLFITYEPVPESHEIFIRFAKVFEQTYTRFLDLKKAEKQAREAQIEASLERIRARTMAMQSSEELFPTSSFILKELRSLGQDDVEGLFGVSLVYEEMGQLISYISDSGGPVMRDQMVLPLEHHPLIRELYQTWKKARESKSAPQFLSRTLPQKPFREWINQLISYKNGEHPDAFIPVDVIDLSKNYFNLPQFTFEDAFFKQGILWYQSVNPISDEFRDILVRFAKVFEQTYTRFLDLQTAEAQAREGEIQLALERVRARTMAMRDSKELAEVVSELFQQMEPLGFAKFGCALLLIDEENEKAIYWLTTHTNSILPEPYSLRYSDHKISQRIFENYKNQEKKFTLELRDEEKREYDNWMFTNTELGGLPENIKEEVLSKNYVMFSFASMKYGLLYAMDHEPISEELQSIVIRFAKVFEQTYTRFLDLQTAEKQAREAEIEASLERIRARTMAMQSSEELFPTSSFILKELRSLGQDDDQGLLGVSLIDEEKNQFISYISDSGGPVMREQMALPLDHHPFIQELYQAWKKAKESKSAPQFLSRTLQKDKFDEWVNQLVAYNKGGHPDAFVPEAVLELTQLNLPQWTFEDAFYKQGILFYQNINPISDEFRDILVRFAKVFEQTYTRFLDLQKAEEQAREARINLAVERVRSHAMAMQTTSDLLDVVVTLRTEFINLGHEAQYFWHMLWKPDKYEKAMTSGDGTRIGFVMELPRSIHAEIPLIDEWEKGTSPTVIYPMDVDAAIDYVHKMVSLGDFKRIDPQAPTDEDIRHIGGLTFIMARTTHGEIGYSLPGPVTDPPQEALDILVRFAGAFDLAHRRFLDLQLSEAQARETQIELSLERIRGQVTSMQESSDLFDIVVAMRKEFVSLGYQADYFWHMRWTPEQYEMSMTSEEGDRIGMVINVPKFVHDAIPSLAKWEKSKKPAFVLALDGEEAWDYIDKMNTYGHYEQADPHAPSKEDILQLGGLTFIIARTSHGEIGFSLAGKVPEPPQESIDTLIRFAGVFDLAYKRFEDLKKAEKDLVEIREAKQKAEEALSELKAAQAQLIQSEKMASLGELTAGIAHEIQNPLNFVNNFSELSTELLDELKEELEAGDVEEVEAILSDLKDNLTKINHHGKRAGSIVKGMLEHSRKSDGKKESVDINALADECIKLGFHGMRAKDKSFSADFKTDLYPDLPAISIINQDIGRVLLNLVNNAFYAVHDYRKSNEVSEYKPMVKLETGLIENFIEIKISDNAKGIPEHILDKIFQPFFTTKPTGEGTGLGLSLSYDIIKAHGGELTAQNLAEGGAQFKITLPIV